jgi:Zn-dependent protease
MKWEMTLLMLPGLLAGLTFHEFAHAWTASLLGDNFARRQGRVSLNPLRHLTPLGTLAILFLPIGWGKPVMINLYNFKHPRRDYLLTSLAGPLANVILAAVCLGLLHLTKHSLRYDGWLQTAMNYTHFFLMMGMLINVSLATLNLLPIPPLDGSKIWPCLLPNVKPGFTPKTNQIALVVFLILIFTHSLGPILDFTIQGALKWAPQSDANLLNGTINAGNDALIAKQWQKAESLYTEGLSILPQSDNCYYGRAQALAQQGKFQDALADIDRAIELRRHPHFFQCRASILIALSRPDDAEKDRKMANILGKNTDIPAEGADSE